MSGLRVTAFGKGRDLALIHGWGFGSAAWEGVGDALAQRFRVHLISLPGYNRPATPVDWRSSDKQAEEAHEYFLSEQASFEATAQALAAALPTGCALCGWSLGAQLAMQATLCSPEHCSRLILVGATPRFVQAEGWLHAQPPALLDTFCTNVAQDTAVTLQRFAALLNQGDFRARANTRWLNERSTTIDALTLMHGLHWLRNVDLREQVANIALPTRLIHGDHDPLMPLAAAQWLNDTLPDSTLEVFAGAAHAPFLNDPERFVSLLTHAALN